MRWMPWKTLLASLRGRSDPRLSGVADAGAKLLPEDVCLIGVRSFVSDEAVLLRQLGVRVYFMHEVRRRGLSEAFAEALCRVGAHALGYGISINLDALDPVEGRASAPRFPAAGQACRYFLTGVGTDDLPWAPPKGSAGAAGLVLFCLGFFCSRLLRICPLAICIS